jgi:hypothetical protein
MMARKRISEEVLRGLEPWLNAKRIGFAADLSRFYFENGLAGEYEECQKCLVDCLEGHLREIEEYSSSIRWRFLQLPLRTLESLDTVLASENLHEYIRKQRDLFGSEIKRAKEQPSAGKAETIAYYMLDSEASAFRIIQLARSTPRLPGWDLLAKDPDRIKEFDHLLSRLRMENVKLEHRDTETRLQTIAAFNGLFDSDSVGWRRVEEVLISQAFCWPVLILKYGKYMFPISIPIAIDISFDGNSGVFVEPESKCISTTEFELEEDLSEEGFLLKVFPKALENIARDKQLRFPLNPLVRKVGEFAWWVEGESDNYVFLFSRNKTKVRIFEVMKNDKVLALLWEDNFKRAVQSAKVLWRSKRGHYPKEFRTKVEHASVTFDLRFADEILRGLPALFPQDRSADIYLAQAVLARFLGRRDYLSAIAIGQIGEVYEDDEGNPQLDYYVESSDPEATREKLSHIFNSRIWERVALPQSDQLMIEVGKHVEEFNEHWKEIQPQSMPFLLPEVNFGAKLSNIADIVHTKGWRQYNYIRCPEIRWALHNEESPRILKSKHPQVQSVLYQLRNNNGPILDLRKNEQPVTPLAVASALWHITTARRWDPQGRFLFSVSVDLEEELDKGDASKLRSTFIENKCFLPKVIAVKRVGKPDSPAKWYVVNGRSRAIYEIKKVEDKLNVYNLKVPPSLSWLFVRAVDEEQDESLWRMLYKAIGAPPEEFESFRFSPNVSDAARRLAEALNHFLPGEAHPDYRTPDVIVLIGPERFESFLQGVENPLLWRLSPPYVLAELNGLGEEDKPRTSLWKKMELELGKTRIILVSDLPEKHLDSPEVYQKLNNLPPEVKDALTSLAVFRFDFKHRMAAILFSELGIAPSDAIQTFLDGLAEEGLLHRGQGWYHLPPALREDLYSQIAAEDERCSRHHLAAAIALGPYLVETPLYTLPLETAFLPEYTHEVRYHILQANKIAQEKGLEDIMDRVHKRLNYFFRYTGDADWNTVHRLGKFTDAGMNRTGYEIGKDLLGRYKDNKVPIPPGHCCALADCFVRLRISGARDSEEKNKLHEELVGEKGLFPMALDACEDPRFESERSFNRLMVLSRWRNYLGAQAPEEGEQITRLDSEIWALLEQGLPARGVRGETFEQLGDETEDLDKAITYYSSGIKWTPDWRQLWIKSLGASTLAGKNLEPLVNQLREQAKKENIDEEAFIEIILNRSHVGYQRDRKKYHRWVIDRWRSGVNVIGKIWWRSSEVQKAAQKYYHT